MVESKLDQAFGTLADAFTHTESEIVEEVKVIEQQIEDLKGRIVELHGKKDTLAHDRQAIEEIYTRYSPGSASSS